MPGLNLRFLTPGDFPLPGSFLGVLLCAGVEEVEGPPGPRDLLLGGGAAEGLLEFLLSSSWFVEEPEGAARKPELPLLLLLLDICLVTKLSEILLIEKVNANTHKM